MDLGKLDLKDVSRLENFSGRIPVFPLSTVVFFPNTLLPLHIFEPRYKQMISDALGSEKIIGMALFKPGWQDEYYGNPDIFDTVGMGKIVSSEKFEDGRMNIVLYGLKRVRIREILNDSPYRLASVDIIENTHGESEEVLRNKIAELINGWNFMLDEKKKSHRININTMLPLANLTDALATLIFPNIYDRQSLLEECSVEKRAEIIIKDLETRLEMLSITARKQKSIPDKRNLN